MLKGFYAKWSVKLYYTSYIKQKQLNKQAIKGRLGVSLVHRGRYLEIDWHS